jgi:hypothetical protein
MQVTTAFATAGAALAAAALAFTLRRACTGTADRAAELRACILLHLVASTATAVACGTFASGAQSWQSSDGTTVALTAGVGGLLQPWGGPGACGHLLWGER